MSTAFDDTCAVVLGATLTFAVVEPPPQVELPSSTGSLFPTSKSGWPVSHVQLGYTERGGTFPYVVVNETMKVKIVLLYHVDLVEPTGPRCPACFVFATQ